MTNSSWQILCPFAVFGDAIDPTPLLPFILTNQTRTYDFVVEYLNVAPDGFQRRVIGINGQLFGPPVTADVGDLLVIKVHNALDDVTTIHWHGVLQTDTNNMDGVPGVNQRAIPPGGNFTYVFLADAPGSYWYDARLHPSGKALCERQ